MFLFNKIRLSTTANQRTSLSNQSPIYRQAVALAVVWLILLAGFLLANYPDQSKLQRYALELSSFTDNIVKPDLLKKHCGDNVNQLIYEHRHDSQFGLEQACQNLSHAQNQLKTESIQQLEQLQSQLATTWQHQRREQRQTDLVRNETGIELGRDYVNSRQTWLHLNKNGQLDSINQLLSVKTDNFSPALQQSWALSLMAVADGNRRFLYSQLFASQPTLAKLLNQTASDVALVYEANRNQQKALQANQLLATFGTINQLGMLPQLFIWSWVAFVLLALPTWLTPKRSFFAVGNSHSATLQNADITSLITHPVSQIAWASIAWGAVMVFVSHGLILPIKVGLMLACGGLLWGLLCVFSPLKSLLIRYPDNREIMTSAWIYPLFVGISVFGLLILFDLSTRSYLPLRYIFLNHFKDLFWCFVFISLARPFAMLFGALVKKLVIGNLLHFFWANAKSQQRLAKIWLALLSVGFLAVAVWMKSDPAKVAEWAKLWLLVFLAVFLAINQRRLLQQLLFSPKKIRQKPKMPLLLLFSLLVPMLALFIADEKGTILVLLFVMTFLLGVALSNKIFQMGGRGAWLGVLSSTAILLILLMILVNLSGFNDRTAERVSAWINPFIATNDQMAILHWFRQSIPNFGYGFGDIPWCGYQLTGCQGVPMQMQSDYTVTSVMAVVGVFPAVGLLAVYVAWLLAVAFGQLAYANEQMKTRLLTSHYFLLSWVVLVWVVVTLFQALVTISGNLGMLPLTGVTLPFVSYGTSNLWLNTLMLSLALYQPKLVLNPD